MFIDYRTGAITDDGAFIQNGRLQGPMAHGLQGVRFDPGYFRPYIDKFGNRCVTINTGRTILDNATGRQIPEVRPVLISYLMSKGIYVPVWNATSLRKEEWIQLDNRVQLVARARLTAAADLRANNPITGFDAMSHMTFEYQVQNDPGEAVVDMDALTDGRDDSPLFALSSIPLPITHSDFGYSSRQLAVSSNNGQPLDMIQGEAAGRRVGELIEKTTIGTVAGIQYGYQSTGVTAHRSTDASTIYGFTNSPYRITKTDLNTPSGSNPEAVVQDVNEMIVLAEAQNFFGPYILYHSTSYSETFRQDYFRTGGTAAVTSVRERVMQFEQIQDIRRLDYLTSGYQLLLVQQSPETAQMIDGMDVTTIQWEEKGGLKKCFKVMAIQVPLIRGDYREVTGIVHGTTA